jgi:hypothetical protein
MNKKSSIAENRLNARPSKKKSVIEGIKKSASS